jgi:hypothetical protein
MQAFVRQLGAQPGVQLNPVRDATDGILSGNGDQVVALVGRFSRGRIDRAFKVDLSNLFAKVGSPESLVASALNEARVQAYEALRNGAVEVLVSRMVPAAAALQWVNFTSAATSTFGVSATASGSATLSVLHRGCHNDGIRVRVHADQVESPPGTPVASKLVRVQVLDAAGALLYDLSGSLDPTAKDDYQQSNYLPDVAARYAGDDLEISVPANASVAVAHDAYGRDGNGADKWASSTVQSYFSEGGTTYANTDYDRAVNALKSSTDDFGYIITGGSAAVPLLTRLAQLGYDTNTQVLIDVPGTLGVTAAIAFVDSLGIDSHYAQAYWAPLRADEPLTGGRAVYGTAGAQAGMRCRRNAQTNNYGFAPKNFPVAGKDWALARSGVRQTVTLTDAERDALARAKINPVIFESYNGGGRFVFSDSLTMAKTQVSYRKLIAVAEMSSTLDDLVAKFGKECLQLPMDRAIKRMNEFLDRTLEAAQASGWLMPTDELNGAAYTFEAKPNAQQPADRMDVAYWARFDGTVRAVFIQQTITP